MNDESPELGGALITDIASVVMKDLPFGNTIEAVLGGLLRKIQAKRQERARVILIDEIATGKRTPRSVHEADEFVAILYRYLDAARQGAATLNLRLLAKVIAGQFEREEVQADEFLRFADILTTLTKDEVIFLGTLHRHFEKDKSARGAVVVYREVIDELATSKSMDSKEIRAIAAALQRTGLILPITTVVTGGAGFQCQPSPLLDRLIRLISLEDAALRDATATSGSEE
jgi:hypothetical protein